MILVKEAFFVKSASKLDESTPEGISEIAFIGRSNVGKSSIINALCHRKDLAKSSSTPGKTRLINFFHVTLVKEEKSYQIQLVDLPGFGYAKVSHALKDEWQKHLNEYLQKRLSIRLFVHLIDSRHPFLENDVEVQTYLEKICRPDQCIVKIFTKADKLKQSEISIIKKQDPGAILVSNSTKKGIDSALEKLFNLLFGAQQ